MPQWVENNKANMIAKASQTHNLDIESQDALAFAYQYGYPLYAYGRFSKAHSNTPNNTLIHERDLVKAGWTQVVRPNNDTLYSFMLYDLSQHDLCISVPEFDRRYWAFSFYDMYGNNFANVGSQGDTPRKCTLLYSKGTVSFGVSMHQEIANIDSPTPYGIFLARINLLDQEADKAKVNGFQDGMEVDVKPRKEGSLAPVFDRGIFLRVAESGSEAEQVLQLTAALAVTNQPGVMQDRAWVASTLEKAGIKAGKFVQPPKTSLTAAVEAGKMAALAMRSTAGFTRYLGNNWRASSPLISGNFGSYYAARYLVAVRGYLQPTADQSSYPTWCPDEGTLGLGSPRCTVGPRQAIMFSFSEKPRLEATGFWSLTLYGPDELFVANDLNRYSLGDRSDLTYPDGTPLKDRDGASFEILVQPNDVPPPKQYLNNWLPAPAGGGAVSFTLRLFAPSKGMLDGTYGYPEVTVIDAITD